METNNTANLILERWIASLKTRDRSTKKSSSNFDDLFIELKKAEVSFQDAHALLQLAIKAHYPNVHVQNNIWEKAKRNTSISKQEFVEQWLNAIKDSGTQVFYEHYKIPGDDDDVGPKVFGSMSEKEYRLQRNYADSFPVLNTDLLRKKMIEDQDCDFEEVIKHVLGGTDGTTK